MSDTQPSEPAREERGHVHHVKLNTCLLDFSDELSSETDSKKIIRLDESTSQLIILYPQEGKVVRMVYANTSSVLASGNRPTKREIRFSVQNKDVTCAKFSPDDNYIAFQSNPSMIEFIHLREESQAFIQSCKKSNWNGQIRNSILGFYWTYSDNMLFITLNGLDLYQFPPTNSTSFLPSRKKEMKAIKDFKQQINWFVYSAKHRVVLASTGVTSVTASGHSSTCIQGFYLEHNNIVKLGKFNMEKKQPPSATPNKMPVAVKQEELTIASIYGRLYCIHTDNSNSVVTLYLITRDDIRKFLEIRIPSREEAHVHVIDNLLVMHCTVSKVALIYDIKRKKGQEYPFSEPLPLSPTAPPSTTSDHTTVQPYQGSWVFFSPNLILDEEKGYLWDVSIDLEGIAASCSERKKLIHFVLRRSMPSSKELLLRHLRNSIQDQESLSTLAKLFDCINFVLAKDINKRGIDDDNEGTPKLDRSSTRSTIKSSSDMHKLLTSSPNLHHSGVGLPSSPQVPLHTNRNQDGYILVTQQDMYQYVFLPFVEQGMDHQFMIGVITEYTRSLHFNHVTVDPLLYQLLISYLVRNDKFYQLHQMLQYHVVSDSAHVACQLLSLESRYPPAYQLALDMFKRLNTDEEILEVLLTKRQIVLALRFLRSHRNLQYSVARILDIAATENDPTLFYTTYKFFEARREIKGAECAGAAQHFQQLFVSAPSVNRFNK
ncbi:hypothetical protein PROFUN_04778 [Planoprotostelium fungivorum]|uniref:Uncharacterized protein n=1 Tax=Planoprotostelium fungivorum TaxID=1890364 RepID=A0A2P6NSV3_9EUKA|nr:hypothetical protein PROFUN_04778 [Planoprotostelium fungivorum]